MTRHSFSLSSFLTCSLTPPLLTLDRFSDTDSDRLQPHLKVRIKTSSGLFSTRCSFSRSLPSLPRFLSDSVSCSPFLPQSQFKNPTNLPSLHHSSPCSPRPAVAALQTARFSRSVVLLFSVKIRSSFYSLLFWFFLSWS